MNATVIKRLGLIVFVIVAFITLWLTNKSALDAAAQKHEDEIAALQKQIFSRDTAIKRRDGELVLLKKQDTALIKIASVQAKALDSANKGWSAAKVAIDADAAVHAGLVPIAEVHALELKGEVAIKSCEDLRTTDNKRVMDLEAQVANLSQTRASLDTNRTDEAVILKDTVKILRPPWYRRTISWIGDHAVTLAPGVIIGIVIGKKI